MFKWLQNLDCTFYEYMHKVRKEHNELHMRPVREEFEERIKEMNAVDPENTEFINEIGHMAFVLPETREKCKELAKDDIKKYMDLYQKALVGSMVSLSVSQVHKGLRSTGMVFWPDHYRSAELSIMNFLGMESYPEYTDKDKLNVRSLNEYSNLEDSEIEVYIDDAILQEAFNMVKSDSTVQFGLLTDIANGLSLIYPVAPGGIGVDPDLITVSKPDNDAEILEEETLDNGDTVFRPAPENDLDKPHPIRFTYRDDSMNRDKPVSMDQDIYDKIEDFVKRVAGEDAKYGYNELPGGMYQIYFENATSATIDPDIVIGNGINLLGTVRIKNPNNPKKYIFDNVLVNIDADPDIAAKVLTSPGYILTAEEYQTALSRQFMNTGIYSYIDMSGMSKHLLNLSAGDFSKLGKKLTCITGGFAQTPCRMRFEEFNSVDDFTLVSDTKVKIPIPHEMQHYILNMRIEAKEDHIMIRQNFGQKIVVGEYDIQYGEI